MTDLAGLEHAASSGGGRRLPRYVLHIGLHKTGTSSLQAYLASRRWSLLEHGIDFPLAGRTPRGSQAHRYVVAYFRRQKAEFPPEFADLVPGGLTDAPCRILSSEDFYFCKPEQVDDIAAKLGNDVRVICYLREPVAHIVSMYKEHLKRPVGESLPQFVGAYVAALRAESGFSYYSYSRNIASWRRYFHVTPAPYRREGLIPDFLARCGIELNDDVSQTDVRENISLSDDAVKLQLAVNRAYLGGLIDAAQWKLLRRRIVVQAAANQLPDLGQHGGRVGVDMRDFIAAFRDANPELGSLADRAAETVEFWDSETLDHEALLDVARRHLGADPEASDIQVSAT